MLGCGSEITGTTISGMSITPVETFFTATGSSKLAIDKNDVATVLVDSMEVTLPAGTYIFIANVQLQTTKETNLVSSRN